MLLASSSLPLLGMPGLWEWIIIIAVVLIFFGAAKLPKLGKGLGEGIRNFKTAIKGDEENRADDERDQKQNGGKKELNS